MVIELIVVGKTVNTWLENGNLPNGSVAFADWLQGIMNRCTKKLVFVIGGAYGFSDTVYKRANEKIALSRMTFSHQIVRLIFCELLLPCLYNPRRRTIPPPINT